MSGVEGSQKEAAAAVASPAPAAVQCCCGCQDLVAHYKKEFPFMLRIMEGDERGNLSSSINIKPEDMDSLAAEIQKALHLCSSNESSVLRRSVVFRLK